MMARKIIVLLLILSLTTFSKSVALSTILVDSKENKLVKNQFWVVFITVGEPGRDEKNVNKLYNILLNDDRWDENNIFQFRENEATKQAILNIPDFINKKGLNENDTLLIFFSMHGGRKEDAPPLDEPDNMDEFIIPFQQEKNNFSFILDDELGLAFEKINSKNLVIIFETCFSGGMIDGADDLRKTGRIIMTSSKEDESSYPIFLKKSWLFPYFLIEGLSGAADKDKNGVISAEEVFRYAKILTIKKSKIYAYLLFIFHKELLIQHPQIYDGWPTEKHNEKELQLIHVD